MSLDIERVVAQVMGREILQTDWVILEEEDGTYTSNAVNPSVDLRETAAWTNLPYKETDTYRLLAQYNIVTNRTNYRLQRKRK